MTSIDKLFSDTDRERVNQAVQQAESRTSAEILPVVARSSGRYDRPEDIVGLWLAMAALLVAWSLYPLPNDEPGHWGVAEAFWQIVVLLIATVAGFLVGAGFANRIEWLRRLFTPRTQMRDEVYGRARQVFYDKRVHHTQGASGVLLYVSLFERMAAVITDEAVLEKLGQNQVDALCREFTDRLRSDSVTDALCTTAQNLGERLAPLLPRSDDDINELADALVVIR